MIENEVLNKALWDHKSENPKILDLGCGYPSTFFCLFKKYKVKHKKYFTYYGIDKEEEYYIFNNINKKYTTYKEEINITDWVSKLKSTVCNFCKEDDFLIDEELFQRYFKFYFNTNVISFLKNLSIGNKFDFIILSDFLHKLSKNDAELVFDTCLKHLTNDGVIYVSLLGENFPNKKDEDIVFTTERYNRIKEKVKIIWCKEDVNKLQFIGKNDLLNTTIKK